MLIALVLSGASLVLIIFGINPSESGLNGIILFYLALFVFLTCVFTTFGSAFRVAVKKPQVIAYEVKHALRQAILFTLLIVLSLFLLSIQLFTWWIMALLIALIALAELFYIMRIEHKK
ncbi:MAG: hypothetical protein ACD_76C00106G0036 [uncultured bacterium]|nr:MAG: hypothetical protein ACD_76C00106G0036 [uncultured bacterium]HBD05563.1 hypothetical protein [Candidatus Uhrbacteria bacterium]